MSTSILATEVLHSVAQTLVKTRKYQDIEQAFREMALITVRNKMNYYQRQLRRFQRKYAMDFKTFTEQLKGKATPAEEDDWLAWRSAQNMEADWKQTYQELLKNEARRLNFKLIR
jgi:hypothetical protein